MGVAERLRAGTRWASPEQTLPSEGGGRRGTSRQIAVLIIERGRRVGGLLRQQGVIIWSVEVKRRTRLGSARLSPPPLQELLLYFQQSPAAENSYGLELLLRFHIVCILYLSSLLLTRVQYILQYMYNILYTTYRIPDTTVVASVYRFLFQRTGFSPQNSSLI